MLFEYELFSGYDESMIDTPQIRFRILPWPPWPHIVLVSIALVLGALVLGVFASHCFSQEKTPSTNAKPATDIKPATNAKPTTDVKPTVDVKPAATEKALAAKSLKRIRKVKRVARPKFDNQPSDVWFDDVARQGLVGARPTTAQQQSPTVAASKGSTSQAGGVDSGFRWSSLIGRDALEDEIKSLSQDLAKSVTTPVRFKTNSGDVHQAMAMLSLSFAVIREYDDEVRWKDSSAAAQAALQQAMVNSRSNSDQAFNYCKSRKFDLEDLVRGGSFPESEKPDDALEWADVIGRTETMIRLENADDDLKEWTADKKTFTKKRNDIAREAQWIAAIAEAISREGMDDADDDGYLEFSKAMKEAALNTVTAVQNDDFDSASRFANQITQSCDNCHEQWR